MSSRYCIGQGLLPWYCIVSFVGLGFGLTSEHQSFWLKVVMVGNIVWLAHYWEQQNLEETVGPQTVGPQTVGPQALEPEAVSSQVKKKTGSEESWVWLAGDPSGTFC